LAYTSDFWWPILKSADKNRRILSLVYVELYATECRNSLTDKCHKCYQVVSMNLLVEKIVKHDSWPIQPDILSPPLLWLTSRKPLWLDLQPADIKSQWRHNWKSAQVVNSHLVCDPTIRQPGFDLPRQQWSLLNRFRTEQGHSSAFRKKWRLTNTALCPCGETRTMSHIVESCPLTKLNGSLSGLHSADEDAVSWLTSYGSWNAYEKKNEFTGHYMVEYVCLVCVYAYVVIGHIYQPYVKRQNTNSTKTGCEGIWLRSIKFLHI